jgi:lycopene cyclase domain-containing protein
MSLYLILELIVIIIPLIFSFDKNLRFYRNWKSVLSSLLLVSAIYIPIDIYFTMHGIWGFNPEHHSGIVILSLPLEEWLFFFTIPYASMFLHYTFVYYFPAKMISNKVCTLLSVLFIVLLVILIFFTYHKTYTFIDSILLIGALIFSLFDKAGIINRFYITFLIILVPFILLSSILTGSFINNAVYWYNNSFNLGVRIFTIPVEDIGFAFSLILFNILLIHKFQLIFKIRST